MERIESLKMHEEVPSIHFFFVLLFRVHNLPDEHRYVFLPYEYCTAIFRFARYVYSSILYAFLFCFYLRQEDSKRAADCWRRNLFWRLKFPRNIIRLATPARKNWLEFGANEFLVKLIYFGLRRIALRTCAIRKFKLRTRTVTKYKFCIIRYDMNYGTVRLS